MGKVGNSDHSGGYNKYGLFSLKKERKCKLKILKFNEKSRVNFFFQIKLSEQGGKCVNMVEKKSFKKLSEQARLINRYVRVSLFHLIKTYLQLLEIALL